MSDVSKLPKWAQERIRTLEQEREIAVRSLNEYIDSQTVSPFYYDDLLCLGEQQAPSFKRRYVQGSRNMTVEHLGVELGITLRPECISLSWGSINRHMDDVVFQPRAFQQARLFLPAPVVREGG